MSNKPLMVFVHGWGLHSGVWQPLIEQLEPHVECLCIDLPGYGTRANEASPSSLTELAHDLLQKAPAQAHWCAWSLGGMAALEAAATNHEYFKSLTLICSTPKFIREKDWPLGMPARIFKNFYNELEADYHSGIKKFLLLQAGSGTVARDAVKKTTSLLKKHPEPSSETLRKGLHILDISDLRDRLSGLPVPCRILSGRRDRIVHPDIGQQLSGMLDNAELIEFNSGHAPHLSHTGELANLLLERLNCPNTADHTGKVSQ